MGMEVRPFASSRKRTIALAIGASLLLVLFVAGLAFANSIGASRVAENARSLHWANATLGTSSLTRAAIVQAITFTELDEDGLVTTEDITFAMDQVVASYSELSHLEEISGGSASAPYLTHFVAEVGTAIDALGNGDVDKARSIVLGDVETAYLDLVGSLRAEQEAIQAAIEQNTAAATRMNGYVVFVLMLAIPAFAVGVYWWIARRQVREYRLKTELELESERAVSKAKDSFIAGLSHELRTPLTSIYGFAEILTDRASDGEAPTGEIAQIIANEAAEMTRMVDDLLAASRLESTGVEIEISGTGALDVIASATLPFERAGLEIKKPATNPMIATDAPRLRHVLVNLLSNAARHGGNAIGIDMSTSEGMVDIEVWDNGPGVPEDQLERLFERFVHDGSEPLLTGSIGLGLAVASRLTGMLGGRLSYQRFGGKTYFIVSVPALAPSQEDNVGEESVAEVIRALSG